MQPQPSDQLISAIADDLVTNSAPVDSLSADALSLPDSLSSDPITGSADQLFRMLEIGGPVVWILIALSVFSLSIIFLKLWQFTVIKPESTNDISESLRKWRSHDPMGAVNALHSKRPVSGIIGYAMQGITQQQDHHLLQDELSRQATHLVNQLRTLLRPLEVIASLSPLLGLMGTVLGMIVAFQQMEAAGNSVNPSVLSGGIWQALLTTAVGLAVAIPVATAHSILERKVERTAMLINDYVTQVFTCPLAQSETKTVSLREHSRAA
ncbi:MAG: MotA/TolQ/ExbB proton channel family protein [Oceanospirillales bacterium]|nr:MotA/TolQ/ExbB proton channel family protein [Oceanospirillales bacterium]MBR9887114.1 MotA/TolQ/ExbB proton channel family protein [Oceanospirillales bacterium]